MIVVAIGIIGATVMPHNLYLHSALVQSRQAAGRRRVDPPGDPVQHARHTVALSLAFLVNAAILVLAATVSTARRASTLPGGSSWHSRDDTRLDSRRLPDARAAAGHGRWPASCSPSPCWPAGKAARSPARWPGRS